MSEATLRDKIELDVEIGEVWRFLSDIRTWSQFVENLNSWEPDGDWVSGECKMSSGKCLPFEGKVIERVFEKRIALEMLIHDTEESSRITYELERGRDRTRTVVRETVALRLNLPRPLWWLICFLIRVTKPRGLSNLGRLKQVIESR